jgi:hypothetical protein
VVDRRVVDRRVVDKQVVDRSRGRADTPTGPSGAELDFLLLVRSLLSRRCQTPGDARSREILSWEILSWEILGPVSDPPPP